MICQERGRTIPCRNPSAPRVLAAMGMGFVAAVALAMPQSAHAQMCESAGAGGGSTGGGGGGFAGGTAGGGGFAAAGSALSSLQSAQSFMQQQQQRNLQLQQMRQRQAAWLNARNSQNVRDNATTRSNRVSSAEAQARRDERKRLREERWALRKARLNRMREEIEAGKTQEVDSQETRVAAVTRR